MDIDDRILELECYIEDFKKKIDYLDKSAFQVKYHSLPNFKTNKSQLPFESKNFKSQTFSETIRSLLIEESCNVLSKKITPMPGLEASFCYNFLKNVSTFKGPMQFIYGLSETSEVWFEEILRFAILRHKKRFQDMALGVIGKEDRVVTRPVLLENGNTIIEEYDFFYHNGDYEKKSPVLLQGKTKLIKIMK